MFFREGFGGAEERGDDFIMWIGFFVVLKNSVNDWSGKISNVFTN